MNDHEPPAGKGVGAGRILDSLAKLEAKTLLDATALAAALGVTKRTIRRMVAHFELPPPVPFAGRSTWQAGKVLAWFEARAERAEREAERRAVKFRGFTS